MSSSTLSPTPTLAYKEEWASGPHDTNFYTRIYTSAHTKALLVFVHGAAEHAGRYTEMHTVLAREHDIAVFMFDQRGFGRTALDIDHKSADAGYGKTNRGYQMNDLEWAIEHARTKVQNVPVFLMGTSMGGGEVLGLLCDRTRAENVAVKCLAGVVAGSPCIILTNPIPWPVMWVARRIADVRPYTQFPFRNNSGDLSRNPETNAAYDADPLIQKPGSLRSLGDMIDAGGAILGTEHANWPENIPVLFLHGTSDNFTSHKSTEELYKKIPAKDKKLILYPGALHELHNEPDGVKEKSLADVVAFIQAHIGAK